jgi:hypothetical protein
VGNLSIKKLRRALEAAGQGASGSPRHTFTGSRHQEAPTSGPDDRADSHPVTSAGTSRHDHFFREITLHPQGGVFLAKPFQLGPLSLRQILVRRLLGIFCFLHPLAQRHLVDADTFRYFGDRSAGIEDEANGLILEGYSRGAIEM